LARLISRAWIEKPHVTGRLTLGVDIGGTKVLAGVVDEAGAVLAKVHRETPGRSQAPDVVESTIVEAVNALEEDYAISAIGIGAAGFVDPVGRVLFAPHLSWREEPLQAVLTARLGVPVMVDNDANTAAWAEMRFGAGRGYRHALCVTLGTGIGGALVVDGRVIRGAQGIAGEFGHMQLVPNGRPCECGQAGCWEQYCSGKALIRVASEKGQPDLAGPAITAAAAAGEPWALQAFAEVGEWLGVGVAGLVSAFDPEIVIIGGGLSDAGELLLVPAREAFVGRLPGRGFRVEPAIVRAKLGPDAGFIGAADLARALVEPIEVR
jgi:glucokinase